MKKNITIKDLLKGKDLGTYNRIEKMLKEEGFCVDIEGSVKYNYEKGIPRNYNDIDLGVKLIDDTNVTSKQYIDKIASVYGKLLGYDFDKMNVEYAALSKPKIYSQIEYIERVNDGRIKLKYNNPKTIIDISFEHLIEREF